MRTAAVGHSRCLPPMMQALRPPTDEAGHSQPQDGVGLSSSAQKMLKTAGGVVAGVALATLAVEQPEFFATGGALAAFGALVNSGIDSEQVVQLAAGGLAAALITAHVGPHMLDVLRTAPTLIGGAIGAGVGLLWATNSTSSKGPV